MKKNILLVIAFMAFSNLLFSQVKIILPDSTTAVNSDTVIVAGNSTDVMNQNLYIVNPLHDPQITLFARRDSLLLPMADTDNTFCWAGLCYANTTNVSGFSETINGGDTANGVNEFTGHYYPYGHTTTAFIRYTFYNANNPTDSVWVVLEYFPKLTGIKNIAAQSVNFSAPYPNPANSSVNFSYSLTSNVQTANLKIFNMLGECVQTLPLNAAKNKASINVRSIPSGIYVCEIEASGCQPAYQKLIVSH